MKNANGQEIYLVQGIMEDEEFASLMTAKEIFDMMDMDDCYQVRIEIWRLDGIGSEPEKCGFCGTWHDWKDPLKMKIVCNGETLEVGWGTDH